MYNNNNNNNNNNKNKNNVTIMSNDNHDTIVHHHHHHHQHMVFMLSSHYHATNHCSFTKYTHQVNALRLPSLVFSSHVSVTAILRRSLKLISIIISIHGNKQTKTTLWMY